MPNPNFEPIIGSSFDAIAAQRAGWAGFNANVENANLGRAQAAQETQNRWLAQVSAIDQQDAARADRLNEFNLRTQIEAAQTGENNRRWAEDRAFRNKAFDVEENRYKATLAERNRQEKKALDIADNWAKSKAEEVSKAGDEAEASEQRFATAQERHQQAIAEAQAMAPPGVQFNPKSGTFVPLPRVTIIGADKDKLDAANAKLAESLDSLSTAANDQKLSQRALDQIRAEAQAMGVTLTKQGNKWRVYSPSHDRWYGKEPTAAAPDQPGPPSRFSAGATLPSWAQPMPANRWSATDVSSPELEPTGPTAGRGPDGRLVPLLPAGGRRGTL